ncbi:MAG TPA: xanthine dehydrogenase family protein subunit M, partial [Rudaea sp.]|nr:xanthine dehydrogenase family protein subunit M [Rudaea sp.]
MIPLTYSRPSDIRAAVAAGGDENTYFIGGGTNLIDLMKAGVEKPTRLVDVNHLGLDKIEAAKDGGLRIGAGVRNTDAANHPAVRKDYPLLSQAFLAGASAQLRNMATVGGNLLQRTRCDYFVDTGFDHCNKRKPGSGCAALKGWNRTHAILGASEHCVAVNPSDMNVALVALDAVINVQGPNGDRQIHASDFHRLPGDHPEIDTTLKHGELITSVDLPKTSATQNACYLKLRERNSYAFALVSVAVALNLSGRTVQSGRIVIGGVAHKPWFAEDASNALNGKSLENVDFADVA